jgi:hypothetical protein
MAGIAALARRLAAMMCTAIRSDKAFGSIWQNSRYPANPALLTSRSGSAAIAVSFRLMAASSGCLFVLSSSG